jgi:acyl transferase domain-containing protein
MAAGQGDRGSMLAVQAAATTVKQVLKEERIELVIANRNTPKQAVLSGATAEIRRAADAFANRSINAKVLPVAAAFHSPFVAGVKQQFAQALADVPFAKASIPVYSNTTALPYPDEAQAARSLLAGQLAEPVAFVEEIEALHRAGVRTFIEVGPSNKLTGMVGAILEGREHHAFAVDASSGQRNGFLDLARALAPLAALGHRVELGRWDNGIADVDRADHGRELCETESSAPAAPTGKGEYRSTVSGCGTTRSVGTRCRRSAEARAGCTAVGGFRARDIERRQGPATAARP